MNPTGGQVLAREIVSQIVERAFEELDEKPVIVAGLNVPMPYNRTLEGIVIPSEEKIKHAVLQMMDRV